MADYNEYYEYTTMQGDTFDMIALDFYDSEHYVQTLMDANPEYIKTLVFSQGVILKIPIIEEETNSTLPPWKRG